MKTAKTPIFSIMNRHWLLMIIKFTIKKMHVEYVYQMNKMKRMDFSSVLLVIVMDHALWFIFIVC